MSNGMDELLQSVETPSYLYDLERVRVNAESFRRIAGPDVRVVFATMANPAPLILREVARAGLGVFVNCLNHLEVARSAGVPVSQSVFAGSGHTGEVQRIVSSLPLTYCADSLEQLRSYLECRPSGPVGLRINIGSLLNDWKKDSGARLGVTLEEAAEALRTFSDVTTLHIYVGTNLRSSDPFVAALRSLYNFAIQFRQISHLDIGGGYATAPSDTDVEPNPWGQVVSEWSKLQERHGSPFKLVVEPGRSIVSSAGRFVTSVTDVKMRRGRQYIVVDTSATWYPRTLIHDADDHLVRILNRTTEPCVQSEICGSTTFSQDVLARAMMPCVRIGDRVVFENAGAYCQSMHLDFLGVDAPSVYYTRGTAVVAIEEKAPRDRGAMHG